MILVKYDKKRLGDRLYYSRTNNMKIIEEFVNSDMDCAKVKDWKHKSAWGCAGSLNKTIGIMGKKNIKAISKNGEVFLVKTE